LVERLRLGGSAIADRLVAAGDLGKWASVGTEVGISGLMGAAADATTQGISIAAGWQNEFSAGRMGIAAGSAAGMAGFRIASQGCLQNSTSAAKEYFAGNDDAKARYMRHIDHDPTNYRHKGYREGGYFHKKGVNGVYRTPGGSISNYNKSKYTFAHEMSHAYHGTGDRGMWRSATAFSSWVFSTGAPIGDPYNNMYWVNGVPKSGNYVPGEDYTVW
jgi:hypothetical protein